MNSEAEKWTREKHFNWDSKEEDTNPYPSPPPFHKKNYETSWLDDDATFWVLTSLPLNPSPVNMRIIQNI